MLHLSNHLFALGGPALHITVMKFFRMAYRFPPVEVLLMLCVTIQIVSGLWLVFRKGFKRQPFVTALIMGSFTGLFYPL